MAEIETFNLKDIHQYFDNVFDLEMGNLVKVLGPMVGSISTPFGSQAIDASKNVETPSNLDVEAEIAQEVLKVQLTLNQQAWVLHQKLFLLWYFFMVNDGKKLNPLTTQTMCYLVCHSIYQTCSVGSSTKKWKGMIFYNQQHGTISMNKHIWQNIQLFGASERLLI